MAAATALLDRGYGKPLQAFQLDGTFAAKKLHELSDEELAILEARLASDSCYIERMTGPDLSRQRNSE
jgi:hypothetical protein